MRLARILGQMAIVLVLAFHSAECTGAVTRVWHGLLNDNVMANGNWSGSTAPGPFDTAVFPSNSLVAIIDFYGNPTYAQVDVQGDYLFTPVLTDRTWTVGGDFNVLAGGDATIAPDIGTNFKLDLAVDGELFVDFGGEMYASNGNVDVGSLNVDGLFVVQKINNPVALTVATAATTPIGDASSATMTVRQGATTQFNGAVEVGVSSTDGAVSDLNIESGSDVTLTQLTIGGGSKSTSGGTVTLTGVGSSLVTDPGAGLTIGGAAGTGAGALVMDDKAKYTTGVGTFTVGQTGSLSVGGGAELTIKGAATLPASSALSLDGGTLHVDGGSLDFGPSSSFYFGGTGGISSKVNVTDGGEVTYWWAWAIASSTGSSASTTVSGVAGGVPSTLRATDGGGGADVMVGRRGTGTLDVLDGGLVFAGDDLFVGRDTGGVGTMSVRGVNAGTLIRSTALVKRNNSTANNIYVGGGQSSTAGTGELRIEHGGLVETSGNVFLGQNAGADGTITFGNADPATGIRPELNVAASVYVGGSASAASGTGLLDIGGAGRANVGTKVKVWPGGEVRLGVAGRLTVPLVEVSGGLLDVSSTGVPGSLAAPTVNVTDGGQFRWRTGGIATGMNTTVTVDGPTSTFADGGVFQILNLGTSSRTGTLTLQNGADGNLVSDFVLGDTGTGILNLLSGAELITFGDVSLKSAASQVNVDQTSKLLQNGAASLDAGSGSVSVSDDGLLSTGTGVHTVADLAVSDGGTFMANGPTTLYDATLTGLGLIDVNNDLILRGSLSAALGTELGLAAGIGVELQGAGDLTFEGDTLLDGGQTFHLNGSSTRLASTGDLTVGPGTTLRLTNGTVETPGDLTIQPTGRLDLTNAGSSPGGIVRTKNLDLQAGALLDFDDGLIEVDGGVLTVGDPDLVVEGDGFTPLLRLKNGATTSPTGFLTLGGASTNGSLELLSGATAAPKNVQIAPSPGGSGSLTVSGVNSSLVADFSISVGGNFSSTAAGAGTLSVTGSTASVEASSRLRVGHLGDGLLNTSGNVVFGDGFVGSGVGGDGAINMTGGTLHGVAGVSPLGLLYVGTGGGNGELAATDGSIRLDRGLLIGVGGGDGGAVPSVGIVTLDGGGVSAETRYLSVGVGSASGDGNGTLELLDGADLTATHEAVIGTDGGTGSVLLEDPTGTTASTLAVGNKLSIGIDGGEGELIVRDGSQVTSSVGFVAETADSVGMATLSKSTSSGPKSAWSGEALYIGGDDSVGGGDGDVFVGDNAELNFSHDLKIWSTGDLILTGGHVTAARLDRDGNLGSLTWQRGHVTLTDSDLFVGTGTSIEYFLTDAATIPNDSSLTVSGEAVVGDPSLTGPGVLNVHGTLVTGPAENTLVGSAGVLNLIDGTLRTSRLELRTGAVFFGSGTVDGRVLALLGSTIDVTGDLTMGDPAAFDGFLSEAELNVAAHQVTLRSRGFVNLGPLTTIGGGALVGSRIALDVGDNLQGAGAVVASLSAGSGSLIDATGDMQLGFQGAVDGFYGNGAITIADGVTVTLQDLNDAVLDSGAMVLLGTAGSATLAAPNGLTLDFGGNITGHGSVDTPNDPAKPLTNNGAISGDSPAQPITLSGYIRGVGTLNNVVITGTDAPGFSPAKVNRGSVVYDGTLQIEIGGLSPGDGHDQINHILGPGEATLGGTLSIEHIHGFVASPGDAFEVVTAQTLSGEFATINYPDAQNWFAQYDAAADVFALSVTYFGDFDGDFEVSQGDLTLLLANWGETTQPSSWLTSWDGQVDQSELTDLLSNWGSGVGAAAVPEPSALALAMCALLGLIGFVRCRRG